MIRVYIVRYLIVVSDFTCVRVEYDMIPDMLDTNSTHTGITYAHLTGSTRL